MKLGIILIFLTIAGCLSEKASYTNYRLLRLQVSNPEHAELLNNLDDSDIDVWSSKGDDKINVLVSANGYERYVKLFEKLGISFTVLVDNYQSKIDEQEMSMQRTKNQNGIIFRYVRYNEILNFIYETVDENPDIASTYTAGSSVENRKLQVIVIKTPENQGERKIWIDCGIHAREWVSPATCVYTIHQLIKEYREGNPKTVAILNKYSFHIIPLVNPDGYEFTHTTERLWRKSRKRNPGSTCIGVDLNRNFDYRFLETGASPFPCSDTYAGPSKNSEPETLAVVNSIEKYKGDWDAYISIHSAGQWWLISWGHSATAFPPDYDELYSKALLGVEAIKSFNGSIFTPGNSAALLYPTTGTSQDWAKESMDIKYSYTLELRPRRGDPDEVYWHALPEDRMPLVAPETYLGIIAFLDSTV